MSTGKEADLRLARSLLLHSNYFEKSVVVTTAVAILLILMIALIPTFCPSFYLSVILRSQSVIKPPKIVLAWTKFARVFSQVLPVDRLFSQCPVNNCRATLDRSQIDQVDAVLFHIPEFEIRDLPTYSKHRSKQLYVFTHFESVGNRYLVPSHKHWNQLDKESRGFFNLTMTYRLDSDIFFDSYSHFYEPHLIKRIQDVVAQKTPSILWLVSHCKTNSHREDYVSELSRFIKVDKFGKCSGLGAKNPCKFSACPADFIGKYKFYLAFENSLCLDYVTEKLYWALNNDVVPIVLGGANYSRFLPANSYLDVQDYPSPKFLADHLNFLMQNETEYLKLLSWKFPGERVWLQPELPKHTESGWCKLCSLLHEQEQKPYRTRIIRNITEWWFTGQCRSFPVAEQLHNKRRPKFRRETLTSYESF